MYGTLITVVHIAICVFLIMLVLLQQGKGADTGAVFGGGSNTLFGAGGADTLLTKVTTFVAVTFMLTSIILAVQAKQISSSEGTLGKKLAEGAAASETAANPEAVPVEPAETPAPAPVESSGETAE